MAYVSSMQKIEKKIAEDMGLTQVLVHNVVQNCLNEIAATIKMDGRLQIRSFMGFRVVTRKARMGCNPSTGEPISIPSKKVVRCKPGKKLKYLQ